MITQQSAVTEQMSDTVIHYDRYFQLKNKNLSPTTGLNETDCQSKLTVSCEC